MGFHLLVRPAVELHDEVEWQISTQEDSDLSLNRQVQGRDQEGEEDRERQHNTVSADNLKLKIPSYNVEVDESNDEGFKTPTSLDHTIPAIPQCPPAPRKPKSIPSRKRKACSPGILLDLPKEIESLFPAPLRLGLCGKIKKVKRGNDTQ